LTSAAHGRIAYFDNLKYILIVLVVVGHFIDPFSKIFGVYQGLFFSIYLFHMPLFVLVTGMFARGLIRSDGRFRIARVLQFLLLYVLLYSGIYVLEYLAGKPVVFTPWSVANASWYLLAAAIWYLLVPLAARIPLIPGLVGSVVLALAVGYLPFVGDVMTISRVICFAPFFLLGYRLEPEALQRFFDRSIGWKIAAAALLAGAFAAPFLWPRLLKLRGLLSARNSYEVLDHFAAAGAGFRAVWYLSAVILGASLLVLVPRGYHWFSTVGQRTLQIYMWHLWSLRALALIALVPLTAMWASASPLAVVAPLAFALGAAHLFALRPPFGLVSERILSWGRGWTISGPAAFRLALATAVLLPTAAWALSGQPLTLTTSASPASTPPASPPSRRPASELDALTFDAPLAGATGFATSRIRLTPAAGLPGGTLQAGEPFTIRADQGDTWIVVAKSSGGALDPRAALIDLADVVPSLVLSVETAPSYRSGTAILDQGTWSDADLVGINARFATRLPTVPVSLATAQKVQLAQRAALAEGNTLIVYGSWRPEAAQQALAESLVAVYDAQPGVREGIDGDGWDLAWFLPSAADSAPYGDRLELSLGKLSQAVRPWTPGEPYRSTQADEYAMPSSVREMSRAAVSTINPPGPQQPAASAPLTEGARRLIGYCRGAGLSVSPSAWWLFEDHQARSWQRPADVSGLVITAPR
jgi:fucose 4-O-acetylase-like acetyltransferase/D-alanyl-D-alanine dipeptidase